MPLVKAVTVKISATGVDDAKLQIDRVRAAAEKLKETNPTITPEIDGAKALIEARLLRAGIRNELAGAAGGTSGTGLLGSLLPGFTGAAQGTGGIIATITGGIGSLASSGPIGIGILAGLAAAAAALVVAIGSVIPALAAAGLAFGAFGVVAFPLISKIFAGVTAVDAATTKVAQNKAWAAIPASLRPAVQGVLGLKSAFDQISKTLQPDILKVFNAGLKVAKDLLPVIAPFAKTAATALTGLLKQADQFAKSQGFKQFLTQMQTFAGPAITTIGRGIGQIAGAIGQLLQNLASPMGITTLRFIFDAVAGAIKGIGLAFKGLNIAVYAILPPFLRAMSTIAGAVLKMSDIVLGVLASVLHGAKFFADTFLPGTAIQKRLDAASASFDTFRTHVHNALRDAQTSLAEWAQHIAAAPKVFVLQADITNLRNNLATAEQLLKNPKLTATQRSKIEANIDQFKAAIRQALILEAQLKNKTITIGVQEFFPSGTVAGGGGHTNPGMATGGVARGSGWTLVGEQGPEMVHLPGGSTVYPANSGVRGGVGGMHIYVTVNTLVADSNTGRNVANALAEFKKRGGMIWPAGGF